MDYLAKKIIIADLDGTLAKSKAPMDSEMAGLIAQILKFKCFAVISGGSYNQFLSQFVVSIPADATDLSRLYLFPTCATSMYTNNGKEWVKVYGEEIPEETKKGVYEAFDKALSESGFQKPEKIYGQLIEDRGTQITFSANGQDAPLEIKSKYDPDATKRLKIVESLSKYLPPYMQAKVGGTNSIDVTPTGIDKGYGIRKIEEKLGFKIPEMLFIGDALFEGGNDYPVMNMQVDCMAVSDPEQTKRVLRDILAAGIS